jgi:hypothetical protein
LTKKRNGRRKIKKEEPTEKRLITSGLYLETQIIAETSFSKLLANFTVKLLVLTFAILSKLFEVEDDQEAQRISFDLSVFDNLFQVWRLFFLKIG